MKDKVLTTENKKDEKFLRKRAKEFNFQELSRREISDLLKAMKKAMRAAKGIGLSANQIGFDIKFFIAEVPGSKGSSKFYAIFNPRIEKVSAEKVVHQEGCLSVPRVYGDVARAERIVVRGFDKSGRPLKIKAWGLLARVFQHEIDHLDGVLFIDKAEEIHKIVNGHASEH